MARTNLDPEYKSANIKTTFEYAKRTEFMPYWNRAPKRLRQHLHNLTTATSNATGVVKAFTRGYILALYHSDLLTHQDFLYWDKNLTSICQPGSPLNHLVKTTPIL